MKKFVSVLLALSSVSAFADRFDPSAITLGARILKCGSLPAQLTADGYEFFGAAATLLSKDEDSFPTVESVSTTLIFGKDFRPMQGYAEIAQVVIQSTETCYGLPETDGRCTEVVDSCARK